MSTAPTPGPTAPQPDRRENKAQQDRSYEAHVELGRRQAERLTGLRDGFHEIMNNVDIPAGAAGGPRALEAHGAQEMYELSIAFAPLEALRNWLTQHGRIYSPELWINGDVDAHVPSAGDVFAQFQDEFATTIAGLAAQPHWNQVPPGQTQSPADSMRRLARMAPAMIFPTVDARSAQQQINAFLAAAEECLQTMRTAINTRPEAPRTPDPTANRAVTGPAAARYIAFRGQLLPVLDEVIRSEFWARPDMSEDRANTVAQMARQLREAAGQRIAVAPGGRAGEVAVSRLPELYTQLDTLISRMVRECEMDRPEGVTVNRDTPELEARLQFETRRRILIALGLVVGVPAVGSTAWWLLSGKKQTPSTSGTTGGSGKTAVPGKVAPPPSDREAIRPLTNGCTITRADDRLTLVVAPGMAATVFAAEGGGGAATNVGDRLRAGTHTLNLPPVLNGKPVRVRVDVWTGAEWQRTTVEIP